MLGPYSVIHYASISSTLVLRHKPAVRIGLGLQLSGRWCWMESYYVENICLSAPLNVTKLIQVNMQVRRSLTAAKYCRKECPEAN